MGNLLKVLTYNELDQGPNFFLDFEICSPSGPTRGWGLLGDPPLDAESEVNNEMANRMSLFYAEATPMLKTLSNATTKFVSENKTLPIEDTTDCLSTMACVCRVMLETPEYRSRFTNTETLLFCMRVMVGVIILYDHVHPVGAFAKTSKIDMKGCIKVLKDQPSTSTEGLLNALRVYRKQLKEKIVLSHLPRRNRVDRICQENPKCPGKGPPGFTQSGTPGSAVAQTALASSRNDAAETNRLADAAQRIRCSATRDSNAGPVPTAKPQCKPPGIQL
ncbi:PREDICTED: protein FAM49B-like [Charadrius vociferus]|uniref:protein FAM49B-like n=1 Tax=Charadrius vociferus TaxID=50402 RepID=UPI0005217174|nr:PREDICTED: protein FAM49B-like [Charadrius vociferus]